MLKSKSRAKRGQFSIIAALLVSIILVAAVITTYSMIRHNPSWESPKVLSSIGEINLAIKRILEFTVGYYGSILQVTGNTTYAKDRATSYLQSGLVNIAHSHPEWNPSFDIDFQSVSTLWFMPMSYSMGNISVIYSLSGLGVQGVNYTTSSLLKVTILEPTNSNQTRILVTRENNEPELRLMTENFFFYNYSYSDSTWTLVHPDSEPTTFSNGTYILQIPSGVDHDAYSIQVVDPRGIMVTVFYSEGSLASGIPQYNYKFTWNTSLYSSLTRDTMVVEALQNGTLRWLDHTLLNGRPIPPIPVKAFRVSVNANAQNLDEKQVAFQVEDWGSNYKVPLGLTNNASVLGSRNMLVFLVNHGVQNVTLWWDGRDIADQTSYAWTNKYFTVNTVQRTLTNTILTLKIDFSGNTFKVISTVGTTQSTAEFMRINNDVADYGAAEPTYAISNGTVRAVVQHEVEWGGGGVSGGLCPNFYAQIVLTLPANATYYTYALRTIFVNSSQPRTITDLCPIQLRNPNRISGLQSFTENGTSSGFPTKVETGAGQSNWFYNFSGSPTGWAHHWSEYVQGSKGAGIMFTDNSNMKLYTFDSISPSQNRGALYVNNDESFSGRRITIEFKPIAQSANQVSFTNPLDVTWHGAVVTFEDEPIYPTSGTIGLWVMVEYPPIVAVS